MWEDMGAQAVLALGDISDSAYDCVGAMDGIKDVNYSSLSNSLDNVKRQIDLLACFCEVFTKWLVFLANNIALM